MMDLTGFAFVSDGHTRYFGKVQTTNDDVGSVLELQPVYEYMMQVRVGPQMQRQEMLLPFDFIGDIPLFIRISTLAWVKNMPDWRVRQLSALVEAADAVAVAHRAEAAGISLATSIPATEASKIRLM